MSDAKPRAKKSVESRVCNTEQINGGDDGSERRRSRCTGPAGARELVLLVSLRRGARQGHPIDALVRESHYERNSMHSYYGM
ncbi:hypothetical protein MTP99_015110 [Tenebrio molitor]|jgi:hypothetical protein|uniref:Uncharacterized protein n=1 Tax=Tenebrio molitor TaxID=7067 RepID=A0A8J6HY82_TENMO|nr:hypothetical protein GEV33_000084 [Tenebrio molitor]KAJ3627758.1 hypothetical protein MTP99_015110 [Tenebrio molitor]